MNVNYDNKEECKGEKNVQGSSGNNCANDNTTLTVSQKARIERNRQNALLLKQARLIPHPYAKM
jgi:hypothetical protein